MFAHMFLLREDSLQKTGKELVNDSFALTHGKSWRILSWILPFILLIGSLNALIIITEREIKITMLQTRLNEAAKEDISAFDSDHSYIQKKMIQPEYFSSEDLREVISIANKYSPQKDGSNKEYLREMLPYIEQSGTMDSWADYSLILGF